MTGSGPVQAVKLDEDGLARLFGELEARIMETVWSLGEASIHDICRHLGKNCHYKTIMTVANRLVEKGALLRRRQGRAFVYSSVRRRDEFLESVSKQTLTSLMNDFGAPAFAGFVDAVGERGPAQLVALRRLIDEKMGDS